MKLTNALLNKSIQAFDGPSLSLAKWEDLLSYLVWLGVDRRDVESYLDDTNRRIKKDNPELETTINLLTLESQLQALNLIAKYNRDSQADIDISAIVQRICDDLYALSREDEVMTKAYRTIESQLWNAAFKNSK